MPKTPVSHLHQSSPQQAVPKRQILFQTPLKVPFHDHQETAPRKSRNDGVSGSLNI